MAALSEKTLSSLIVALERDFLPSVERNQVRRMLIERTKDAYSDTRTGAYVPDPYDKSKLLIKSIGGEVVEGVQHYANRISANQPQPVVPRITKTKVVPQNIEEKAAEQERLLAAMWVAAQGPSCQYEVAWSQAWSNVGWYLTLPRDASWGLPDRKFYDDLTDDELEEIRKDDDLAPDPDKPNGWMESGGNWLKRRRDAAEKNAIAGKSLFTLRAFPGDMVRYRKDEDGIKFAYIIEEVPRIDFAPGSEMMRDIAVRNGYADEDVDRFGIWVESDGHVTMGITQGGERDSQEGSGGFNFIRAFDREYTYYLVSGKGQATGAKLIWSAPHGAGRVPLVPAPANRTDSRRPGFEFSGPMEQVFAYAPHVNQLFTLASNIAATNGLGRWVIEKEDGSLLMDEKGDPKMIVGAPMIGNDPSEAQVIEGKLRQVIIDGAFVERQAERLSALLEKAMPPDVTRGEGGTSGAAWAIRQLLSAAQADLEQPVSNNALAVKEIMGMWVRWMRLLDVPVYALTAPSNRGNMRAVRGLIEIDPEDLIEGFEVVQSKDSASDRIVLQQHGLELRREGVIDDRRFFEEYMLESDPVQAEKDMYAQHLKTQIVATLIQQLVPAMQGRIWSEVQKRFPNSAILTSQLMAEQAQMAQMQQLGIGAAGPMDNHAMPRGNVAQANGIQQPGIGGANSLPGTPDSGLNAMSGKAQ